MCIENNKLKFNVDKNEDNYVIVKDEVIVINEVVSFENPFDNFEQFMVDELFYEANY
jgi:hypothetical protein